MPAPVGNVGFADAGEVFEKLKHRGMVECLARYGKTPEAATVSELLSREQGVHIWVVVFDPYRNRGSIFRWIKVVGSKKPDFAGSHSHIDCWNE